MPQLYFSLVSNTDVFKALRLKTFLNTGTDNLDPYLLHQRAPLICSHLAQIVDQTFLTGMIPGLWRRAFVVPLHESGDISNLNKYNTITSQLTTMHLYWLSEHIITTAVWFLPGSHHSHGWHCLLLG